MINVVYKIRENGNRTEQNFNCLEEFLEFVSKNINIHLINISEKINNNIGYHFAFVFQPIGGTISQSYSVYVNYDAGNGKFSSFIPKGGFVGTECHVSQAFKDAIENVEKELREFTLL